MLGRMIRRGDQQRQVWNGPAATIAISRYDWELGVDFGDGVLLLVEPDLVVAADGSLFYRDELTRRLRGSGIEPTGRTTSHLIAAAYRAWGADCSSALEGDFAFLVWDRTERRAFLSRDFLGKRPLYYAALDKDLIVASTIDGVLGHPRVPDELNLVSIAATAAGMIAAGPETCYTAIRVMPAGTGLGWSEQGVTGPRPYWEPLMEPVDDLGFDDAAERLRNLLVDAVEQRVGRSGTTAVWTSGGWDSSAVFAAGRSLLGSRSGDQDLVPISISYPEGDPGREDELIQLIANRWKAEVHWLSIAGIPYFPPGEESVPAGEEPFRHPFEFWNRALAAATRSIGGRIALDGSGGDQSFQVSPVYLADLFRTGRWLALRRDIRALGGIDFSTFLSLVVRPALPGALGRMLDAVRGRQSRRYGQRWMPGWFRKDFLVRHAIVERELAALPDPTMRDRATAESLWYWSTPYLQRISALLSSFALQEGVELRSPLADRRIVEFALRRPRIERAGGGETKRLLRESMKDWLPAEVLAPRTSRTGTTDGFAHDHMSRHFLELQDRMLARPMVLEELGIISTAAFKRAGRSYRDRSQADLRVALWSTYQAESWLRRVVSATTATHDSDPANLSH